MRVKPYAIRFPSRNARHTTLSAPGGCISTSGCSCRYRSSLRACSGDPGGTSCTGQYRYPVSGQRNGFPKSPATRHRRHGHDCIPPSWTLPVPMTNPGTTFASAAVASQHPYTTGPLTTAEHWSGCSGRRLEAGQPTLMPNSGRQARSYRSRSLSPGISFWSLRMPTGGSGRRQVGHPGWRLAAASGSTRCIRRPAAM